MPLLSLCLIMKNEQTTLHRSLSSVANLCDEIIVIDTGSTDNSINIAKEFTGKIFHFQWVDDFSAARNFAQSKATGEYIMRWDADCVLDNPKQLQELKNLRFKGINLIQTTFYAETKESDNQISQIMPLIYRKSNYEWKGAVHNQLQYNNNDIDPKSIIKLKSVKIYHYNSHKQYRHKQTENILIKELEKDPSNYRYWYFLAQKYSFYKNYQQAIDTAKKGIILDNSQDYDSIGSIIEMIFFASIEIGQEIQFQKYILTLSDELLRTPRLQLIQGDMNLNNHKKAIEYYSNYLKNPLTRQNTIGSFDQERHQFHPNYTLGVLYLNEKNEIKAKKYLQNALNFTKNQHYVTLINSYLQQK